MEQSVTTVSLPCSRARTRSRTGATWWIRSSSVSEWTAPQQFHRGSSSNSTPRADIDATADSSRFLAFVFNVHPG